LRPTPIFDTNVIADVQRGRISRADWQAVLRHRPRHGWPLSSVTALELLAGLEDIPPGKFAPVSEQLDLAFDLSKGRILEDPRHLICSEVLHVPFPSQFKPFGRFVTRFLDVARHIPPAAISDTISYGPNRVPAARVITTPAGIINVMRLHRAE
jgi:hypothetical protein